MDRTDEDRREFMLAVSTPDVKSAQAAADPLGRANFSRNETQRKAFGLDCNSKK